MIVLEIIWPFILPLVQLRRTKREPVPQFLTKEESLVRVPERYLQQAPVRFKEEPILGKGRQKRLLQLRIEVVGAKDVVFLHLCILYHGSTWFHYIIDLIHLLS